MGVDVLSVYDAYTPYFTGIDDSVGQHPDHHFNASTGTETTVLLNFSLYSFM